MTLDEETQAKLETIYNRIQAEKESKKKIKLGLSKEKKMKLYGEANVILFKTDEGKIGASIPASMSGCKLVSFETKFEDKINEFKNSNDKFKKL